MDMFKLYRHFWDFAFDNPDKIRPNHCAVFSFAVEHCNRLGWKKKFGIPTSMVMEAVGIKSYSVYKKTFDDLIEFGLFEIIEYSKNQYSSNIIALKENNKANDKADLKALDKALTKHLSKQCESTYQSNDSITKQLTINNKQKYIKEFEIFWSKYPHKVAKEKVKEKFNSLSEADVLDILKRVDAFVNFKPFETYTHPNPMTFLNQRRWLDEIPEKKKILGYSPELTN